MIPTLDLSGSYKIGVGYGGAEGVQYNNWDPLHCGAALTLSNQNRTVARPSAGDAAAVISVFGKSSGSWQVEHTIESLSLKSAVAFGVAYQTTETGTGPQTTEDRWTISGASVRGNNLVSTQWGEVGSGYFGDPGLQAGDVIDVVVDIDSNDWTIYINGDSILWDPTGAKPPGTNIMSINFDAPDVWGPLTGTVYWWFGGSNAQTCQITSNFGQSAFLYPFANPMNGPTT